MFKRPSLPLRLLKPSHPLFPSIRKSSTASLSLSDDHQPSSVTPTPPPPSLLPPSLLAHIPPLPILPARVLKTDPRILPDAGKLFYGNYDHLSAINPRTTLRPIWDVGPKENHTWFKEEGGAVPPLWQIEFAWEKMDGDRRERLIGHLKDRQKGDWRDLALVEKKAIWHISYGPWGARAPILRYDQGPKILITTVLIAVGTTSLFFFVKVWRERQMKPDLLNDTEYLRKQNAYMRANNVNPITGVSSSGYSGKGAIWGTGTLGSGGDVY